LFAKYPTGGNHMATLLDSMQQLITPQNVGAIGQALGVDPNIIQQGLNVVGPTVLGGLSQTTNNPTGAATLMNALPQDTGGDMLTSILGTLTGGGGMGTSTDLMQNLMGSGVNAVSGTLSQKLGFDVKPLLMMGLPLVMSLISKSAKEERLDANGVAARLRTESDAFLNDPANAEVAGVVKSALKAGDEAAALRATFSDSEWMKVRMAPMAAAYLVVTASPSGGAGQAQELAAAIGAVGDAIKNVSPTSLISTAFGGGLTQEELDVLHKDAPPRERILGTIRDGLATVKAKSSADANAYRAMIIDVAQKVAGAAKEGGFLGFGGTQVSKEEQQAIDDITAALG
jgi:hypothetical protein